MNLAQEYIKKKLSVLKKNKYIPKFRPGDTIKIHNIVVDETNKRVQIFEGLCISRTNNDLGSTFSMKKISYGMCVEKTFPLYSPLVEKIELVRKGKVRKSKLYFMRELVGKAARVKEKKDKYKKDK